VSLLVSIFQVLIASLVFQVASVLLVPVFSFVEIDSLVVFSVLIVFSGISFSIVFLISTFFSFKYLKAIFTFSSGD
jgi:uncharacterized membrane protein